MDHPPVYVREILKRALEPASIAIILAHNHPRLREPYQLDYDYQVCDTPVRPKSFGAGMTDDFFFVGHTGLHYSENGCQIKEVLS